MAAFPPSLVYPQLRVLSRCELVGRPSFQKRKSPFEVPYQVWALETAGLVDVTKLDTVGRDRKVDWLWGIATYDSDTSC